VSDAIGPLLSSVSVMLAAFGFAYGTVKDRIDDTVADTGVPDDTNVRANKREKAKKTRNIARGYAVVAFVVWLLLLSQIVTEVRDAFRPHLDFGDYSTPNVIFFVAANAWLAVAVLVALRARAITTRIDALAP
jgi:hypothetical protein